MLFPCACALIRTTFYATLARLLFMEDTSAKFKAFVTPLSSVMAALAQASSNGANHMALRAAVPQVSGRSALLS